MSVVTVIERPSSFRKVISSEQTGLKPPRKLSVRADRYVAIGMNR